MPAAATQRVGFSGRFAISVGVTACLIVVACASTPPSTTEDSAATVVLPADVEDQRGRFREIFCAILDERGATLPDARPCDQALRRVGREPAGSGDVVELGQATRHLVALVVPGFGWGCFSNWLDLQGTVATHVRQLGYDLVAVDVDALSSCATNAHQIRDAIMAMGPADGEPRLVLIGYSKGTPDILDAIVDYPEIRPMIAAVVSVAGAVGGSPIADEVAESQLELLKRWPDAECSGGDGGGLESLRPEIRKAWIAANPLPRDVPYYSIVTYPDSSRISSVLKSSYRKLSRLDPRNDGMVPIEDQIVPGSTLLAFVNADHWAVAVPIARSHPFLGSTLVDANDYPREALVEAVLRLIEEDLAASSR